MWKARSQHRNGNVVDVVKRYCLKVSTLETESLHISIYFCRLPTKETAFQTYCVYGHARNQHRDLLAERLCWWSLACTHICRWEFCAAGWSHWNPFKKKLTPALFFTSSMHRNREWYIFELLREWYIFMTMKNDIFFIYFVLSCSIKPARWDRRSSCLTLDLARTFDC